MVGLGAISSPLTMELAHGWAKLETREVRELYSRVERRLTSLLLSVRVPVGSGHNSSWAQQFTVARVNVCVYRWSYSLG